MNAWGVSGEYFEFAGRSMKMMTVPEREAPARRRMLSGYLGFDGVAPHDCWDFISTGSWRPAAQASSARRLAFD
jgi:hypothetical protein